MPVLTFAQFEQQVGRGAIAPVYLFEGGEPYFHAEGERLLAAAALPAGATLVDRDVLSGAATGPAAVLDLADTYPMGGGRRLVVVRAADALRLEEPEPLRAYLARPNPRTCLVFSDAVFDRRRSLYRTLERGAVRVDCGPLDETALQAWVRERLRGRGYALSPDLAEAIAVGLGGAGLARIDAEIAKLMSAIGAPRPVEPADLRVLADVPRMEDVFRLAALVARGRRGEAIVSVRALLRAGEEPVRLLGALAWYFRNALRALAAGRRRLPPRETAALYGLDPGRMARFRAEVGPATAADLQAAVTLCLRMDGELKGLGARDPAHAFERLVHLVGRRVARAPAGGPE
jgi:DNA polymerase-3 subunit delta